MQQHNEPRLICEICTWFRADVPATHIGITMGNQEWCLCEYCAKRKTVNMKSIRPLTEYDRKRLLQHPLKKGKR